MKYEGSAPYGDARLDEDLEDATDAAVELVVQGLEVLDRDPMRDHELSRELRSVDDEKGKGG